MGVGGAVCTPLSLHGPCPTPHPVLWGHHHDPWGQLGDIPAPCGASRRPRVARGPPRWGHPVVAKRWQRAGEDSHKPGGSAQRIWGLPKPCSPIPGVTAPPEPRGCPETPGLVQVEPWSPRARRCRCSRAALRAPAPAPRGAQPARAPPASFPFPISLSPRQKRKRQSPRNCCCCTICRERELGAAGTLPGRGCGVW